MEKGKPSMLILGAGSSLGQALAAAASASGLIVLLTARQPPTATVASVQSFNPTAHLYFPFDVNRIEDHGSFLDGLPFLPDIVVCLVGYLGDQGRAEHDAAEAVLILGTNLVGPASILAQVAARMHRRGHGAIVGVGSVAGDRGRAENYYYGAAKAGLTAYLSGLRQRFGRGPIRVVTVKPGPLRTPMTAGLSRSRVQAFLMATPEQVAPALLRACLRGRGTVYLPWYWRPVMAVVRALPDAVFRRMRL